MLPLGWRSASNQNSYSAIKYSELTHHSQLNSSGLPYLLYWQGSSHSRQTSNSKNDSDCKYQKPTNRQYSLHSANSYQVNTTAHSVDSFAVDCPLSSHSVYSEDSLRHLPPIIAACLIFGSHSFDSRGAEHSKEDCTGHCGTNKHSCSAWESTMTLCFCCPCTGEPHCYSAPGCSYHKGCHCSHL